MGVFVISSQSLFRSGLDSILRQETRYEILGQAENVEQASEQIQKLQPDVIIIDDTFPTKESPSQAMRLLQLMPGAKVIGLNLRDNQLYIYRSAQVLVKNVKDLLEAIEPNSLSAKQRPSKEASDKQQDLLL
jgi:DNA-binding NarL/FixJ family response regulator